MSAETYAVIFYLDPDAPKSCNAAYPDHRLATYQWLKLTEGTAERDGDWGGQEEDPKFANNTDRVCYYFVDMSNSMGEGTQFNFSFRHRRSAGDWTAGPAHRAPHAFRIQRTGSASSYLASTSKAQVPGLTGGQTDNYRTWFFGPDRVGQASATTHYSFTLEVDPVTGTPQKYYCDPQMDLGPP